MGIGALHGSLKYLMLLQPRAGDPRLARASRTFCITKLSGMKHIPYPTENARDQNP